jgi:hypothetical protein
MDRLTACKSNKVCPLIFCCYFFLSIETQTAVDVNFQGHPTVMIPVGEEIYSDPVSFQVEAKSYLAVSMDLPFYSKPLLGTLHHHDPLMLQMAIVQQRMKDVKLWLMPFRYLYFLSKGILNTTLYRVGDYVIIEERGEAG